MSQRFIGCPCGEIHIYPDGSTATNLAQLLNALGPVLHVTTPWGSWLVPRIYVAAHGLTAAELPALAARYGWPAAT